jgi:nucleoside-diphosphate-sugar epimerase
MSRTVALTGATGFIGGTLARRLGEAGWRIRAQFRSTSARKRPTVTAVRWIEGDLENLESLRRLVNGSNAVVHCAGAVRGASEVHFKRVNVNGVARLVQAATEQHPVPRFLLISSLAAREPQLSPYAASKRQGEDALAATAGKMGWTALRPPAVYGPGDRELLPLFRWIARGLAPVLGPESARFSLLYVEDLAEAVVRWLEGGKDQQRAFELHDGHPNGYTHNEVINTVEALRAKRAIRVQVPGPLFRLAAALNLRAARIIGYTPMLTPWKIRELNHPNWVCDNKPLNRAIGWAPRVTLEEGLRRTLHEMA